MSTRIYYDTDADLSIVQNRRLAFIGYGNQGTAQAKTCATAAPKRYRHWQPGGCLQRGGSSGWISRRLHCRSLSLGDMVFLLIPDEYQPQLFSAQIAPHMRPGTALVIASGYNLAFNLLALPDNIDVVMVAPRMIAPVSANATCVANPILALVSVERDASGNSLNLALSIARGIGATRGGSIQSTALEEAALDLFSEQAIWPTIITAFQKAYEVLHQAGFSDEAILYEMYLSKEPAEVFERMAEQGFFGQLSLHSHTSQYGQLRAMAADDGTQLRDHFKQVLDGILSGRFAQEWSDVQHSGEERLEQLRAEALTGPFAQAEKRVMGT